MGGGIRGGQARGPWVGKNPSLDMDIKAKVSGADTTTDFLASKIIGASGISIATLTPGGNERLQISLTASAAEKYDYAALVKDGDEPYVRTSSATYEILGRFYYLGSTAIGAITAFRAVATCLTSGKFADLRAFDFTNGNIMAQILNVPGDQFAIVDFGAIVSVPAVAAIIEIQGRIAAVNGDDLLLSGAAIVI